MNHNEYALQSLAGRGKLMNHIEYALQTLAGEGSI